MPPAPGDLAEMKFRQRLQPAIVARDKQDAENRPTICIRGGKTLKVSMGPAAVRLVMMPRHDGYRFVADVGSALESFPLTSHQINGRELICHETACALGLQPRPGSILVRSTVQQPKARRNRAHFRGTDARISYP